MAISFSNGRDRYKVPIVPTPTVRRSEDYDTPQITEYDEVIFDYHSNRYLTLSQQKEIYELKDQLAKQKEEKKQNLKNIIGYYYKR